MDIKSIINELIIKKTVSIIKGAVKPVYSAIFPTITGAIIPPILYEKTAREAADAFLSGNIAVDIITIHIISNAEKTPDMNINIIAAVMFSDKNERRKNNAHINVKITKIFSGFAFLNILGPNSLIIKTPKKNAVSINAEVSRSTFRS